MVANRVPVNEVADVDDSVALVLLLNLLEEADVAAVHGWAVAISYY